MKSIVLAGALAQKPGRGGHTWVFLQYLLGFRRLGWDVLFLDHLAPGSCIDEQGAPAPLDQSWNLAYIRDVMCRFGLGQRFAVLSGRGSSVAGLSRDAVMDQVRRSSVLINVMGFLDDEEVLAAAPRRVFLDIDPGFGQMWQALGLHDPFQGHDAFVTIGERIGQAGCPVPTCGHEWMTTKQPVVLDAWPASDAETTSQPITSIVTWRGTYGPITYEGRTYGLRAGEFRKFAALPKHGSGPFELALDIHPGDAGDAELLKANGWSLVPAARAASDPWLYAEYIRRSAAELMVAKNMYVDTQSGWISDRSICYLASARPVIAQDTGLEHLVPTGAGLLTFSTLEEAAEAARAVRRDAHRHQRAARRLAEEFFDSSIVLKSLIARLGLH